VVGGSTDEDAVCINGALFSAVTGRAARGALDAVPELGSACGSADGIGAGPREIDAQPKPRASAMKINVPLKKIIR